MSRLPGQLRRFAIVGALGTTGYLLLFVLLRPVGAQTAGLLARVATAVPTAWLSARRVFRSTVALPRVCVAQGAGTLLGAAVAALLLRGLEPLHPARAVELAVLGAGQVLTAGARFLLLKRVAASAPGLSAAKLPLET